MRTTFLNDKVQKKTYSHSKHFSDADLRTNRIDSLLVTQASLLSHHKIRTNKTVLPFISGRHSFDNSHAFNSHGKVDKVSGDLSSVSSSLRALKGNLQEMKNDFLGQKDSLSERLRSTQLSLESKVNRLNEMLCFIKNEAGMRSKRLISNCQQLKLYNETAGQKIRQVKRRMEIIQRNMGLYTGEDKYFA